MTVRRGLLLGLGGIARQAHVPGFLRGPGVADRLKVVATVDAAAPGLPQIPHFADRRRAVEQVPVEFVDVCTPPASHHELSLWALESGYHVLCEKPVALDSREVEQLRAAAAGRLVVMGCHQYRYNPAWQQIRSWLDAGAIGEWHLAEFRVYRIAADAGRAGTPDSWRGRRSLAGGGVLLDHGTHFIYQLLDLAGMPGSIQCWTGTLRHPEYDVEDTAQLLLDFGGRLGVLFMTWAADRRENSIRLTGSDGSIEWSGGVLRLVGKHGPLERDFSRELEKTSYYRWFASLFHAFADRINAQDTTGSLEDIARVTHVLEAAYGAHASGCRVTL